MALEVLSDLESQGYEVPYSSLWCRCPCTKEKEFTRLTPNAMDSLNPREPEALMRQMEKNRPGRTTLSTLREQVAYEGLWPTPTTINRNSRNAIIGARTTEPLLEQVAEERKDITKGALNRGDTRILEVLATPTARDQRTAGEKGGTP